jgi:hypothetical protein
MIAHGGSGWCSSGSSSPSDAPSTRNLIATFDCDGAQPIFIVALHGSGEGRRLWLAFVIGPWCPDDGTLGAWVSIRTIIEHGLSSASITDAIDSPFGEHPVLSGLRGLARAEVFAEPGAPDYFFRAHDDLIRADEELRTFVVAGP